MGFNILLGQSQTADPNSCLRRHLVIHKRLENTKTYHCSPQWYPCCFPLSTACILSADGSRTCCASVAPCQPPSGRGTCQKSPHSSYTEVSETIGSVDGWCTAYLYIRESPWSGERFWPFLKRIFTGFDENNTRRNSEKQQSNVKLTLDWQCQQGIDLCVQKSWLTLLWASNGLPFFRYIYNLLPSWCTAVRARIEGRALMQWLRLGFVSGPGQGKMCSWTSVQKLSVVIRSLENLGILAQQGTSSKINETREIIYV